MTCELHHKDRNLPLRRCTGRGGLLSHPQVHLKCSSTPHPEAPSVGPVGQLHGLSHAPSARAAQARRSGHNPRNAQPASSLLSSSPSRIVCLTSCIPNPGNTDIHSEPTQTRPPAAWNICRRTRTCLTLCTQVHAGDSVQWERGERHTGWWGEKYVFCSKLVNGEQRKFLFLFFFVAVQRSRYNVNLLCYCIRLCAH